MILSYRTQERVFVFMCSYFEREKAKAAGFRWNPVRREWWTDDIAYASRLAEFADHRATEALDGPGREEDPVLTDTPSLAVPAPPGLSYLPYQISGIGYAFKRRDVLIADEMGLGKTIEALGLANLIKPARVLIVCPASLRLNWLAEWKKWATCGVAPVIVTDTWYRGITPEVSQVSFARVAVILSYEGMLKWKARIDQTPWDLAIFDEAHALKNPGTKRTQAVFGFRASQKTRGDHKPAIEAKRRVFMTGTPIVNRPEELWPLLHSIDPEGLGKDRQDYFNRYVLPPMPPKNCRDVARYIAETIQWRRADLHKRLTRNVMIRRLKADVLKDLPAKRRQMVLLDVENAKNLLAAEKAVLVKFEQERQRIASLPHADAVKELQHWRGASMAEIARIRHVTALAKVPAVIEHIWTMLDGYEKIVVFAHHHDVLDAIRAALPNASVALDGRHTDVQKQEACDRFQQDRTVRMLVGGIRAAGLGWTFTAGGAVAFAELDWTPAGMVQAEDRLHRIGQKSSVHVQHLVLDGSIDCHMSRILMAKAEMIDAIIDGKAPPGMEESVVNEILRGGNSAYK